MADVESLELLVEGNATGAKKSLDDLISTLDKLEKATAGGCGLSAVTDELGKLSNANKASSASNRTSSKSFVNLATKVTAAAIALKKVSSMVSSWIKESSDYTENLNLFTVSMGKYAQSAMDYANSVSDVMGIDPSEWMRAQGVFMTLATGFGVAGDRAALMSEQLTQLGYDISSYYNLPVEEAMQKLKSGFAGELEPLRNLGYDLSQAKLEATALSLGIDKAVSSMTQAEKAELRYYAVMTQVTQVQGDMARTLKDPANQMRVFSAQVTLASRALGDLLIPVLNEVLPIAIAVLKVFTALVKVITRLFGVDVQDGSIGEGLGNLAGDAGGASDAIDGATDSAKKLKKTLLGIDELNVMSDTSSGSDSADASGGGFSFNLPTYDDFLGNLTESSVATIVDEMMEWLGITEEIDSWAEFFDTRLGEILKTVGIIGGAFAAWKIANSVVTGLEAIKKFASSGSTMGAAFAGVAGLGLAFDGFHKIIKELDENWTAIKEGDWSGVDKVVLILGAIEVLGGIATALGAFMKIKSAINLGKAAKDVKEVATATESIKGVATATESIGGATSTLTTKLGDLAKNLGLGLVIIAEVAAAAIIFVGAIWVLGEELAAIGTAWKPVIDNAGTVAIAIVTGTALLAGVGAAAYGLGTLGTALMVNIALGAAVMLELGVVGALFMAEVLAVGLLLSEILTAWNPVIANGGTVATAIGVGAGLLVGIGVAAAALGVLTVATVGLLPLAIGVGTALLVELAAAFVAFTASLIRVAYQLSDELHPAMQEVSGILPRLTSNMSSFTSFMAAFAGEVVKYSANSLIAGIAATITTIIGFFTVDPVMMMANEVDSQIDEFDFLIAGLETIIPKIDEATSLVRSYNKAMGDFESTAGANGGLLGNLGIVTGAINSIIGGIEALSNGVIRGINAMINALNKLSFDVPDWVPGLGGKKFGFNLKTLNTISIPRFAEGGYPTTGQMFIANEAGPELVGTIGNRSAVVNNDQIVSSVSQGVYQAVVQAMGQSGGNQVVEAKVNDKVLFEVVVNRNRQETMRTGYSPLLGGV